MKRFVALLLVVLMIFGAVGCGKSAPSNEATPSSENGEAPVKTRKLTFSHVFQTNHPVHIAHEANEMLKEKTGGRFIEIVQMQLMQPIMMQYQLRKGNLDTTCLDSASDWLPKSGVLLGTLCFQL